MSKIKTIIGIDEAGRGCLAGPVVVGAALIKEGFKKPAGLPVLKDSKKMSPLQRRAWYDWVNKEGKSKGIIIAVSSVNPQMIDKINISQASNLAAERCLKKLLKTNKQIKAEIILDGGLFVRSKVWQEQYLSPQIKSIKTIISADNQFTAVKIAAIMAKVKRDNFMNKVSLKYKNFGFEKHKGYGTTEHIKAIKNMGAIHNFHRKTFITRWLS